MILHASSFRLQQNVSKRRSVIALTLLTWIFCTVNSLSHSTVESGGMVKLGRLSQLKQHRFLLGNKVQMMSSNAEPFTTRVNIPPVNWKIDHRTPIHLVGSCFTDTISSALKKEKFDCFSNGQGIMFNPISISGCLKNVLNRKVFTESDLAQDSINEDTYHSWDHHSSYSALSTSQMLIGMNRDIVTAHDNLKTAKVLFVTLGTARVHLLKSSCRVVSNCHKQPSDMFEKVSLSVDDIVANLRESLLLCRNHNPNMKIVLTVSPVRHTREGMVENSLSKSTLICAAHTLIKELSSFVDYFPSYEIFNDELRDYRWYGSDLIHPSEAAQNLIYRRFSDHFMSEKAIQSNKRIASLQSDMDHRPSESLKNSKAYVMHLKRTLKKAQDLSLEFHGYLDFTHETAILEERLRLLDSSQTII